MKTIKVFFNGKRLKDIYPYATRWEVFKYNAIKFVRKVFYILALALVSIAVGFIIRYNFPKEMIIITEKVVEVEPDYPVLAKIAQCESGNRHFGESGQVLMVGNDNKSVDVGRYQINNAVWGKTAHKMGLDITLEKDNEEFAKWLYKNYGTEPWVWSKKCWR